MARGYWVTTYRSVSNPTALARYAERATPVILRNGGRILARGIPARCYEAAEAQRCVVIEFDSFDAAVAAYEDPAYQEIAVTLQGAAVREVRVMEGAA
ncbi:MAG TPA: DUF1330 domain-containing protein [Thermoanaerobaculia bacterium]|nr:DUF1330 domain-containing protein [Thermoanaerobaculia bacterium]